MTSLFSTYMDKEVDLVEREVDSVEYFPGHRLRGEEVDEVS